MRGPETCLIKPKYVKLLRREQEVNDSRKYDHYKDWEGKECTQVRKVLLENKCTPPLPNTFYQVCKHRHSIHNNILNISLLLGLKSQPSFRSVFLVYHLPLCCVLWITALFCLWYSFIEFAGAVLDIANCNLATVQPQPISPHCCLILSLPTSQIQEEKTSESERWQNVSGALGSCCYCCTVVVSPNSPTETGWVTSQRQAHRQ